jgi:putative ABC transport system permease protein
MKLTFNYFKVAFRNLLRQRFHTGISIIGLSVGLTFSLLICLYVLNELSYDSQHKQKDRIYMLPMSWHFNGTKMPTSANCSAGAPFMKSAFPQVEEAVRISMSALSFRKDEAPIKEKRVYFADSSFFKVFTYSFIEGNPEAALVNPFSIILTRSMAEKYFGNTWQEKGLIGKSISTTTNKDYLITGVIEDVPSNSHLQFDFVASFSTLPAANREPAWDNSEFYTYLLLNENADVAKIKSEIPAQLNAKFGKETSEGIELDLVPLADVYLRSSLYHAPNTSNIIYVQLFSLAAILVMLIAVVNYVNMATARSMERAKEVGVRKVMGAFRIQLFYQFLSESMLVTGVSILLALLFSMLALPFFNSFSDKNLSLTVFTDLSVILAIAGGGMVISLLAGIYPAFFISGYEPVKILKGKLASNQGIRLREWLVIGQFLISGVLIVSTIMISKQLGFIQNKDTGFARSQLVSLTLDSLARTQFDGLKHSLLAQSQVSGVAASFQLPTNITHQTALSLKNEEEKDRKLMNAICVSSSFTKSIGLELVTGTDFTADVEKYSSEWEILINQSAAKFFGWTDEDAIGKELTVWQTNGKIKGVVKDFHFASLHDPIKPLVIFSGKAVTAYSNFLVRVDGSPESITTMLQSNWSKINPDSPFVLTFLDSQFEAMYNKELQLSKVASAFAFLAIFISMLGLFGLASYTISQRTRELGIRKVLGASFTSLLQLVSTSFMKLVFISFLLAAPTSWYLVNTWLNGFAYHISFDWMLAALVAILTLLIAFIVITYHALTASRVNPAETLRSQ